MHALLTAEARLKQTARTHRQGLGGPRAPSGKALPPLPMAIARALALPAAAASAFAWAASPLAFAFGGTPARPLRAPWGGHSAERHESVQHARWHGWPHNRHSPQVGGSESAFGPWRPTRPPEGEPSRAFAAPSPSAGTICPRRWRSIDCGWSHISDSESPRELQRLSARVPAAAALAFALAAALLALAV